MISFLIAIALLGILIAMLLAPIEVLGWWAGWYGEGLSEPESDEGAPYEEVGAAGDANHYVVFLDGIAKVGADNYDEVEGLLDRLSASLENAVVLGDVMPYSPRNLALTEGRPLAPWWRYAFQLKQEGKRPLLAFTINIRNLLQVGVAADRRYGPIYGQGEAQSILNSLLRAGYRVGSGTPITLIGYSGGAQIAVLAAPFLKRALHAPVSLISLGGVMASERGLLELDHFYHLQGEHDRVVLLGKLMFPGRWPLFSYSYWNRVRRRGKPVVVRMEGMKHHQSGGYLDPYAETGGESHLHVTSETIVALLRRIQPDRPQAADEPAPRVPAGQA